MWALPGGVLEADETLEESMRRHLADKVDVREVSHLEQLETRSDPGRHRAARGRAGEAARLGVREVRSDPGGNPAHRELAPAFLGLVPSDAAPELPADTR